MLIVLQVFALQLLQMSLQCLALSLLLDLVVRQLLLRDVSIIKVDSLVLVPHLEVSPKSGIRHNLLVILNTSIVNFITVEHWDGLDVFEGGLQSSIQHDILLLQLHIGIFFLCCQLLIVSDQQRVLGLLLCRWLFHV